jgi:glycosyltransferase involved in cell wall biosynthesis
MLIESQRSDPPPLVSVIIPAFNAEVFLERTLRSVLSQTYEALEVIVVNDGSTDQTLEIAQAIAENDNRLYVISTKNGGVARSRNRGIEASRGRYLAFLDADDLWHPTKIALQVAALHRHDRDATWGAVYTLHRKIDENDVVTDTRDEIECRGYMLARHIVIRLIRNGSTLLVRRDVAVSVGGFDPNYADNRIGGCEDLDFELRIAARYRLEVVRAYLVGYRVTPGNMSSNRERMARAMMETVKRHVERNASLPLRVRRWALARSYLYAFSNFVADRRRWPALGAFRALACNDPLLATQTFLSLCGSIAKRPFASLLARRKDARERRHFFGVDPFEGIDRKGRRFPDFRIRRLSADDLMLERRIFLRPAV